MADPGPAQRHVADQHPALWAIDAGTLRHDDGWRGNAGAEQIDAPVQLDNRRARSVALLEGASGSGTNLQCSLTVSVTLSAAPTNCGAGNRGAEAARWAILVVDPASSRHSGMNASRYNSYDMQRSAAGQEERRSSSECPLSWREAIPVPGVDITR